jgi:hypothetical protein
MANRFCGNSRLGAGDDRGFGGDLRACRGDRRRPLVAAVRRAGRLGAGGAHRRAHRLPRSVLPGLDGGLVFARPHSSRTPLGSHRALGSRGGRRREDARPPPAASGMVAFPTTRPHVFAPSRRGDPYSPPDLGGGCRHIGSDHPHRSRGTPPPGGGAAPASHRPPAAGPGSHRHARGLRTRGQRRPNRRRARASGASRLHQVRQQRVKVLALRLRLRRRPEHPDR